MNHCSFELLSAYADGEAADAESRRVEAHRIGCRPCSRTLDTIAASRAALSRCAVPSIPADLSDRLDAMVREIRTPAGGFSAPRAAFAVRATTAAAAVAACLALALWARHAGMLAAPLELPVEYLTAAHNQYALTLPLAPSEKIMTEMPSQLALGRVEARHAH